MEQAVQIDTRLADRLLAIRDHAKQTGEGATLSAIADAAEINRATVSQIANRQRIPTQAQEARIWAALIKLGLADTDEVGEPSTTQPQKPAAPTTYKSALELYETQQYREAMGWCEYIRSHRKMGVMIGHPGTGKTTILKAYCKQAGARYVECWPMMRCSDLLQMIAATMGIALSDKITVHQRIQKVIKALNARDDIMLVFDEAEQLTEDKGGVKKIEMLRKLWDNTHMPIIFAGTTQLRTLITRGSGGENLAQLYRRKYEIELTGVTEKEVRSILRDYNVAADAAAELTRIATDTRHGGMGNFVELLGLCLDAADGERIDGAMLAGARRYKLMY